MKTGKLISVTVFVALLIVVAVPVKQMIVFAQGGAGYTKVGTVSTTSFVDSSASLVAGQVNNYEVTAVGPGGESGPSSILTMTTPNTAGPHNNSLSWSAGTGGGTTTGYNVYKQTVAPPNPPVALTGIAN